MSAKEKSNLILYRFKENGLEVFLMKKEGDSWELPQGQGSEPQAIALDDERIIELDPIEQDGDGILEQAYAVEADWHDIPSLKSILKHDLVFMKDTVKQMVPDMMERGTYVAVKEAFRRVLPNQYSMIKELKDILRDRNSTRYM